MTCTGYMRLPPRVVILAHALRTPGARYISSLWTAIQRREVYPHAPVQTIDEQSVVNAIALYAYGNTAELRARAQHVVTLWETSVAYRLLVEPADSLLDEVDHVLALCKMANLALN